MSPQVLTEHLQAAWNITSAIRWLGFAGIDVAAFKSVSGSKPVIQILPTDAHYDNPLNGCTIVVRDPGSDSS